jgi:hypothetical protein
VLQELDDSRSHVGLQDERDVALASVTDIREGPADVSQDFFTVVAHEDASQGWNTASHSLKFGTRAATTEVCKGPASISNERRIVLSLIE